MLLKTPRETAEIYRTLVKEKKSVKNLKIGFLIYNLCKIKK